MEKYSVSLLNGQIFRKILRTIFSGFPHIRTFIFDFLFQFVFFSHYFPNIISINYWEICNAYMLLLQQKMSSITPDIATSFLPSYITRIYMSQQTYVLLLFATQNIWEKKDWNVIWNAFTAVCLLQWISLKFSILIFFWS